MIRYFLQIGLILTGCSLSDISEDLTRSVLDGDNTTDKEATEIAQKVYESYGGLDRWRSIKRTTLTYVDSWPNLLFSLFGPWATSDQYIAQSFWNGTFDSEMLLLNGPRKGRMWKMNDGTTYKIIDGRMVSTDDPNTSFYLPTYQYFVEFPYRLSEIPILKYGGDTTLSSNHYYLIFGTLFGFS